MNTFKKARIDDHITRAEFAKMISVYATTFKEKIPDTTKTAQCSTFKDLDKINEELQSYVIQSCELGLMGHYADGIVVQEMFRPHDGLVRAEVATVLSRLLRGNTYQGTEEYWYHNHLLALRREEVIKQIDIPFSQEIRGNVFLMLMRIR